MFVIEKAPSLFVMLKIPKALKVEQKTFTTFHIDLSLHYTMSYWTRLRVWFGIHLNQQNKVQNEAVRKSMIHRLQKDTKRGTGCDQNVWTPESEDDGEEGREGGWWVISCFIHYESWKTGKVNQRGIKAWPANRLLFPSGVTGTVWEREREAGDVYSVLVPTVKQQ